MQMEGASSFYQDEEVEVHGVKELKETLYAERQVLMDLYNELEKERSAAATAANEAMAMITRLQEEKAASQMESMQFQRMAEEKQLYDQEAIALLQDILILREQQMSNLEQEVERYTQRLLALTMDELVDRYEVEGSGSPDRASCDNLLVERETLLLGGDDEWKEKFDDHDERLLAEIRDWITAANADVSAEYQEQVLVDETTGKFKLPQKHANSSFDFGKKSLMDTFDFVIGPAADQSATRHSQFLSLKKATDESGLMTGMIMDAEANFRAMEQKRIAILDYVSKSEEQLPLEDLPAPSKAKRKRLPSFRNRNIKNSKVQSPSGRFTFGSEVVYT